MDYKKDSFISQVRGEKVTPCYIKGSDILEESIEHIYHRRKGKNIELVKGVVRQWLKSDLDNFRHFMSFNVWPKSFRSTRNFNH